MINTHAQTPGFCLIRRQKRDKRSRDHEVDGGRPFKRLRDDSQVSNSLHKVSGGTGLTLVGESYLSKNLAARQQDDDGEKLVLKHINVPNNRLLQSGIPEFLVNSQQPRRSPRIAAHQDLSKINVTPPRSSKSSRQRSRLKSDETRIHWG